MENLSNISVIKEILSRHGFNFSHSLGQNFLINPSVCPKMASMSGADKNTCVLEIGPGIGVLTKELGLVSKKVAALEIDKRLIPVLDETLGEFDNIKIINADAMKTDIRKLMKEEFGENETVVCANLPYYITSPIIMYLLEEKLPIKAITVMVQREAAERLCAKPGERACGAVSAAVHYYSEPKILFQVSRGSFMPSPNVDSAVIRLDIRKEPPVSVTDEESFFALVKASFSQRRKTLLNSASSTGAFSKELIRSGLSSMKISENIRAEQMSLENFAELSEYILKENQNE